MWKNRRHEFNKKKHVMPKRPIAMYSKTVSPILQKNVFSHSLIIKADRL